MGIRPFILLLVLTSLVALVSAAPVPPDDYRLPPSSADLIYNGTYNSWMFNLTHPQSGNSGHPVFEVYMIAYGLMGPILAVWGYWVFLIVWWVYLATVWIRSGDVGLPLVIGLITIGSWSMLFPTSSYLFIGLIFATCLAAVMVRAFTDR